MLAGSFSLPAAAAPAAGTILVNVDDAKLLHLSQPAAKVFVANPDIADLQAPDPSTVIIFGKKVGMTRVFAFTIGGAISSYRVVVTRSTGQMGAALRTAVPNASVSLQGTPNGVIANGDVATALDALRVETRPISSSPMASIRHSTSTSAPRPRSI